MWIDTNRVWTTKEAREQMAKLVKELKRGIRRSGHVGARVTLYVQDIELLNAAKIQVLKDNRSLSEIFETALFEYVGEQIGE